MINQKNCANRPLKSSAENLFRLELQFREQLLKEEEIVLGTKAILYGKSQENLKNPQTIDGKKDFAQHLVHNSLGSKIAQENSVISIYISPKKASQYIESSCH